MNHAPRLTVGLPVFNGEDYLAEALESLLAQTFTDFELIISDNASTDGTEQICRRYAARDPRVHYVRQPRNLGISANHNVLVALARAFYWQQLLDDGVVASGTDIAQREGLHHSTVNELLRLTLLEPAIIQSILAGQQPRCMSLIWFQRNPLPLDWIEQLRVVDGFDA